MCEHRNNHAVNSEHIINNRVGDTHLSLKEVGRKDFASVAIEEGEGSAEGRNGNAPQNCLSSDSPPTCLSVVKS